MISSQDGTDERRDRPPAAFFLAGRSCAGACWTTPASPSSCSAAAGRGAAGTRTGSACGLDSGSEGAGLSRLPMGVTVADPC